MIRITFGDKEPVVAAARALATDGDLRAVVLVEGMSDEMAVRALAERRERDLDAERIAVVAIGGATNIGHFVDLFGPRGFDVGLAGLCDLAEEGDFRRALERAGLGVDLDRAAMEALGFSVCVVDLEDELIRRLGVEAVEAVVEREGELGAFRTLQKQSAQQGRTTEDQLRRFMGTRGGRKIRYGRLLVDALDLENVPAPLDAVLRAASRATSGAGAGDRLIERLPPELNQR